MIANSQTVTQTSTYTRASSPYGFYEIYFDFNNVTPSTTALTVENSKSYGSTAFAYWFIDDIVTVDYYKNI